MTWPPYDSNVPEKCKHAYEEWRAADRAARAIEAKLSEAWEHYYASHGAAPSADLMQAVSSVRSHAQEKLVRVINELRMASSADQPSRAAPKQTTPTKDRWPDSDGKPSAKAA